MKRTVSYLVVFSGLVVMGTSVARAEQAKPAAAPAAPAMDPAMEAAMKALQEIGAPSENHQALQPFVGSWTYTAQWWMAPNGPPQTMTGTAVNTLIFGGRFLKEEIHGEAKDQPPFEGLGFTGYDNLRKEYQSVWLDNMATGMMVGSGPFDAQTKAVTQQGEFSCPLTRETHRKYRTAWTVVDADHNTYENYMQTPEGVEFKAMEIHYTRAQ